MKRTYEAMSVSTVGSVGTIINKTGAHYDYGRRWDTRKKKKRGGRH